MALGLAQTALLQLLGPRGGDDLEDPLTQSLQHAGTEVRGPLDQVGLGPVQDLGPPGGGGVDQGAGPGEVVEGGGDHVALIEAEVPGQQRLAEVVEVLLAGDPEPLRTSRCPSASATSSAHAITRARSGWARVQTFALINNA
nr:hypothetical protein [Nocardioides ochotonae]